MEISVVIPVYRAADFVADAVRSALAQQQVREVVLVEDGSPDASLQRCLELVRTDHRVRLYQHPEGVNRGAAASRNLGMRRASCAFVAFLDADDRYLPGRFDKDQELFAQHADADGVYSAIGVHFHDEEGQRRFEQLFRSKLTTIRVEVPPEGLFDAFLGLSGILDFGHFSLDGLTLRRGALEKMPTLMREDIVMGEDTEFILRLSFHLRLFPGQLKEAVGLRGVHADNRITNDPRRKLSRLRMYEALWEWARETPMKPEARTKIAQDVARYRVFLARTVSERWEALKWVVRYPAVLKRLDVSEAFVALFFGRGTWLTKGAQAVVRLVHAGLWRLKGGAPPPSSGIDD